MRLPNKLKGRNLYHLLEIENFSSEEEIKRGYRRLAWEYHPDRFSPAKDAALKFELGSEAYKILKVAPTRYKYDAMLHDSLTLPWRDGGNGKKVWNAVHFSASFNDPGRPKEHLGKQSKTTHRDRHIEFWRTISQIDPRPKVHSPQTRLDGDYPGFIDRCRSDFQRFLEQVPRLSNKSTGAPVIKKR